MSAPQQTQRESPHERILRAALEKVEAVALAPEPGVSCRVALRTCGELAHEALVRTGGRL